MFLEEEVYIKESKTTLIIIRFKEYTEVEEEEGGEAGNK